jgi:prolyl oligopeptidase
MTRKNISLPLLLSFLMVLAAAAAVMGNPQDASSPPAAPPKTAVNEVKETVQGTEIIDPYRWLEDQNSAETRAWIDAQNAYSDGILAKIPRRETIRQQVTALIKIDSMGTPLVTNNRYFFSKRKAEQDQASLFMRQGLQGKDELLIDPLPMSARHTVTVKLSGASRDGSLTWTRARTWLTFFPRRVTRGSPF